MLDENYHYFTVNFNKFICLSGPIFWRAKRVVPTEENHFRTKTKLFKIILYSLSQINIVCKYKHIDPEKSCFVNVDLKFLIKNFEFLLVSWTHFRGYLALSWLWGEACGLCPKSRAWRPCLPSFILLGSFRDTLLVVSILDIVYDSHSMIAICRRFCSPEGVKEPLRWRVNLNRFLKKCLCYYVLIIFPSQHVLETHRLMYTVKNWARLLLYFSSNISFSK